ncbi:mechanosensitive ion channel protein [Bacillus coahuilensis p1.1.43]|uniref:Mechanosensitive ion channel protein n=1 Tax=Bacillus coahuilensis p1.1.43 TaxID=1150625 RepID=A0A147KAF1_9BACI|nr:mechanosensitive ion channel family protein [Bacillus coahuilensis]KUP07631.1 mechanosensitive ion channel protein [Bacillus coahuilensis p1.1.43]
MDRIFERIESIDWNNILVFVGGAILQIIALFIGFLIVKSIGNSVISRFFTNYEKSNHISQARATTLKGLTKNILNYILIFVFFVTLLQIFDIEVAAILAGAGIVGLAVGFGAQGLVSDIVTGFFILLEKQLDVGDYVSTGSFSGIVESVGLRTTQIRGFDGTLHYIPNRDITSVSNHSRGNMRALVDIGISYDDHIDTAVTVMQEVCDQLAKENDHIIEGPNVLGVQSLGSSDVVIRIVGKTKNGEQWGVERELRKQLKAALDANGIEIPYPHQVFVQKTEAENANG